jgi:hypothetical protein
MGEGGVLNSIEIDSQIKFENLYSIVFENHLKKDLLKVVWFLRLLASE